MSQYYGVVCAIFALSVSVYAVDDLLPAQAIKFTTKCINTATGATVECPTFAGTENNQGAAVFGGAPGSTPSFGNIEDNILGPIFNPTPRPTAAPITSAPSVSPTIGLVNETSSPITSAPTLPPTVSASPTTPMPTGSPIVPPRCTLGLCAQCTATKLFNPTTNELIQGCGFETSNDTRVNELANITSGDCVLHLNLGVQTVLDENGAEVTTNVTMCLSEPIVCGVADVSTNTTVYDTSVCPIGESDPCGNNTGVIIIIVICVLLLLIVVAIGIYYVIWTSNTHKGPHKMEVQ